MRALITGALASALVAGACGGAVAPSARPTPTPGAAIEWVQLFYARSDQPPLAVPLEIAAGLPLAKRIEARFAALAAAPWLGPDGAFNTLHDAARVAAVAVDRDLAVLDFAAVDDQWGVEGRSGLCAFIEQVVFTATDERSIYKVLLTQNGGADAVLQVGDAIATYRAPLTRESVSPNARADHSVVYFARDQDLPIAVFMEGAGTGATADERIASRLIALERAPRAIAGDAFNVVAGMKARLDSVRIDGDLVTIDYRVADGDWGVHGSAAIRALIQQLVFTASEEPGIVWVLITQNGGQAVIGGEGLVIDAPQTRRGLMGD